MDPNLPQRVNAALSDLQNMGEMADADAVGTVGNAECGEMMRLWIKYKEEQGKRIIERASFQSFGCETAIAVASLATQMLKGRTREEAMAFTPGEMAPQLGPLPPMKIHCAELVQAALRSALDNPKPPAASPPPSTPTTPTGAQPNHLVDSLSPNPSHSQTLRITFISPGK